MPTIAPTKTTRYDSKSSYFGPQIIRTKYGTSISYSEIKKRIDLAVNEIQWLTDFPVDETSELTQKLSEEFEISPDICELEEAVTVSWRNGHIKISLMLEAENIDDSYLLIYYTANRHVDKIPIVVSEMESWNELADIIREYWND